MSTQWVNLTDYLQLYTAFVEAKVGQPLPSNSHVSVLLLPLLSHSVIVSLSKWTYKTPNVKPTSEHTLGALWTKHSVSHPLQEDQHNGRQTWPLRLLVVLTSKSISVILPWLWLFYFKKTLLHLKYNANWLKWSPMPLYAVAPFYATQAVCFGTSIDWHFPVKRSTIYGSSCLWS